MAVGELRTVVGWLARSCERGLLPMGSPRSESVAVRPRMPRALKGGTVKCFTLLVHATVPDGQDSS